MTPISDLEICRAYPIDEIPARTRAGAAIIHMILNNLDSRVAQFPEELVTYGGNGQVLIELLSWYSWIQFSHLAIYPVEMQVLSNWAQFWIVMHYLSTMSDEQTLVMYSGHPMGLFPSTPENPRMIITNGMVVPNYSSRQDYDRMFALGVTM